MMVDRRNRIGEVKQVEPVERARGIEADRHFDNLRTIRVGDDTVTVSPGAEPVVGFDRFGTGAAMRQAAETVTFDTCHDMATDRVLARHRTHREAVADFAR